MRTLCAKLAFILAVGSVLWAQPGLDAGSAHGENAVVRGFVRSAQTGEPLKGAKVAIVDSNTSSWDYSGFDGSFEIEQAPVGTHSISVRKSGYEDYWGRISIPSAQPLEGVDFRLKRLGVITGQVRDENGTPVEGAKVEAIQETFFEGSRNLVSRNPNAGRFRIRTDDRGVYRIFGLSAGEYRVLVTPREEPASHGQILFAERWTYFPGVDTATQAGPIQLGWGEEEQGIDIQLKPSPPTVVAGRAFMADSGEPCRRCSLELYRSEGSEKMLLTRGQTTEDGFWLIEGLAPGDYVMSHLVFERRRSKILFGSEVFTVAEGKPEAVVVKVFGERKIPGRLMLRGLPEAPSGEKKEWSVRLQLDSGPAPARGSFVEVQGTGTEGAFELGGYPGTYRLRVDSEDWYVEQVEMGGRPLPDSQIIVLEEGLAGELVVRIAFGTGKVAGTAMIESDSSEAIAASTPTGGLLPDPTVVLLIPRELERGFQRTRRERVQDGGGFEIPNLPPGEYTILAVPERLEYKVEDPGYQRQIAGFKKGITVKRRETTLVNLRVPQRLDKPAY